jgi:hypothetical protein
VVRVMMFNATFNNISAIFWRSVLLTEEISMNDYATKCMFSINIIIWAMLATLKRITNTCERMQLHYTCCVTTHLLMHKRVGMVVIYGSWIYNYWRSVLLTEEIRIARENHRPAASHWQTLSHNVVSSKPHYERDSNSKQS